MVTLRIKCFLLVIGTLPLQLLMGSVNMVIRALALLLGYHFWKEEKRAPLEACKDDLIRTVYQPMAILVMELAALYGLISPLNGRKVYATHERMLYSGRAHLAPCFQPDPGGHLFGGDLDQKDEY